MALTRSPGFLAFLALLAGAAAIAFAPIFVRYSEVGPVATAFWRMFLTLPFITLWMMARGRKIDWSLQRTSRGLVLLSGLCFTLDLGTWYLSVTMTSVANSTFLVNLTPVLVGVGGWWFFKERLTRFYFLGLLVAVLGMGLLFGASFKLSPDAWRGDALAVFAAVFYAAYQLILKHLRSSLSTAEAMFWTCLVAGLMMLLYSLLLGEQVVPKTLNGWGVLLAMALVCQLLGQTLITYAAAHLPASMASTGLLLQPVLATFMALYLFGEPVSIFHFAGGALVLAGILLVKRGTSSGP